MIVAKDSGSPPCTPLTRSHHRSDRYLERLWVKYVRERVVYTDLDYITSIISTAFANGTVNDFATAHLDYPQVTNPQLPILSPTPFADQHFAIWFGACRILCA